MDFVGIDKLSILDYEDKLSCVLFFQKCNFRCPFCHNGLTVINSNTVTPWKEIIDYLNSRKGILDAVVVSGGEATLMDDLIDKIKEIKSMGFLVKLDTNGTNPDIVEYLINNNLIDYVAMDIKNSEEKYALTTGLKAIDMSKIKKTISILKSSSIEYEFRTTLVKEFHSINDMEGIGQLIQGSKKLYLQKFVLREGCFNQNLHEVSGEEAKTFKGILEKYVQKVELRGY